MARILISSKTSLEQDDILYFDSDEEFINFCIVPYAVIEENEKGIPSYAGDFYSDMYKKSIAEGKKFVIKDENSWVYKNSVVCKRIPVYHNGVLLKGRSANVQLSVENLEMFYEDLV